MSDQYVGEIRLFAGNYAPVGWAFCNGSVLSISGNEALFSLLGTTYGGDGITTFGLPDLRGRVPIHTSSTIPQGTKLGTENVTLTSNQLPAHTHTVNASNTADSTDGNVPENLFWGLSASKIYNDPSSPAVSMNTGSIGSAGGNQPHNNMMPTIAINYIIAKEGIYPNFN